MIRRGNWIPLNILIVLVKEFVSCMPQVVKWMSLADNEATPAACNWVYPVIGILEPSPAQVSLFYHTILQPSPQQ